MRHRSMRTAPWLIGLLAVGSLGLAGPTTCFEPERRISPPGLEADVSFNFKKSVATLDDGSVHVTWHAGEDGLSRVFYRRSPDGGEHWEPARPLSAPGPEPGHPAIAASHGRVYVAWHERRGGGIDVVMRRSPNGGHDFAPPQPVSQSGTATHASVAADGPFVHVVWGDSRSGNAEIYARSSDQAGDSFGDAQRLSDEPYESWVPNIDAHGPIAVAAWVDYRDANEEEYIRVSRDGGASWEPAIRVTEDPADSWAPSVAVRGSTIFMTWFDRRPAGLSDADVEAPLDVAFELLGLPAWPAPPRDPAVYYLHPFLARIQAKQDAITTAAPGWVASGGDPAVLEALLEEFARRNLAWTTGWGIFLTRSPDLGRTWEPARLISTPGGPAERPSLDVTVPELHVAWYDRRHGDSEIYYRRSSDLGDHFGPEQRITRAPGDGIRPSLAALPGRVFLVWRDERSGDGEIFFTRGVVPPLRSPSE